MGGTLLCFEQDGRKRWERGLGAEKQFLGRKFSDSYSLWLMRRLNTPQGPRVLTVANHHIWFPAQVALLEPRTGQMTSEYWHPGSLRRCVLHELDQDGWEEILLAGINNPGAGLGHAALAVLKVPFQPSGQAAASDDPFATVTGGGSMLTPSSLCPTWPAWRAICPS